MADKHTEAYLDGQRAAIAGDSVHTNPYSLQRHSNSWKRGYLAGTQYRASAAEARVAKLEQELSTANDKIAALTRERDEAIREAWHGRMYGG